MLTQSPLQQIPFAAVVVGRCIEDQQRDAVVAVVMTTSIDLHICEREKPSSYESYDTKNGRQ